MTITTLLPFALVKNYSKLIENSRTPNSVFVWAGKEMQELDQELEKVSLGQTPGDDGVVGEAVDVICCLLDLIMLYDPNLTSQHFNSRLDKKCQKWYEKYNNTQQK